VINQLIVSINPSIYSIINQVVLINFNGLIV